MWTLDYEWRYVNTGHGRVRKGRTGSCAMTEFNRGSPRVATEFLTPCCGSDAWIAEVVAGRPYDSVSAVQERSARLLADLEWPEILQCLAAHPPIGKPPAGADREAQQARHEQAASALATAAI